MSPLFKAEYLSAGGNRNSAAADWSVHSNCLAYGADQNIALWPPHLAGLDEENSGLSALIPGHDAKVTAVRFVCPPGSTSLKEKDNEFIISGDAEGHLRVTSLTVKDDDNGWQCIGSVKAHVGTVNTISCLEQSSIFITGGADALIKIWRIRTDAAGLDLVHTITTQPRFIPLSVSIGWFDYQRKAKDASFIVAAGTRNDIQVYSAENLLKGSPEVHHCATLVGHEGWIRSLALAWVDSGSGGDSDGGDGGDGGYMLASASADKYIRLWKFTQGDSAPKSTVGHAESGIHQTTLSPKLQTVSCSDSKYTITFEALLLGHEDWVYSAAWSPRAAQAGTGTGTGTGTGQRQLLTASADGSLIIWEPDPASSVWYSASRLGEISGQKGATTATGSSGGFWTGLWSPDGRTVTCLGRTGSWRLWNYDRQQQYWTQRHAVSGHIGSVNDVQWATDGSYLLSTSSDQTTRLHAEWKRGTKRSWHEFARPQIHGYDLNCLSSIDPTQFASGADEKLLRVFDEPKAIASMLQRLCRIEAPGGGESLPDTAAIPVLGLSNKAGADEDNNATGAGEARQDEEGIDEQAGTDSTTIKFDELVAPPTEDLLSRHTLFPEHEKLYGHGYEISTSAASSSSSSQHNLLATACKASSLDHAVIRLYDTRTWREVKPPLQAHNLTITRLAWSQSRSDSRSSDESEYLLSVGRDRQWSIFEKAQSQDQGQEGKEYTWKLKQITPKAHTRMILDCAWSPPTSSQLFFATAGRDKTIKIWQQIHGDNNNDASGLFSQLLEIKRNMAVTAVDFTARGQSGSGSGRGGEDEYNILAAGEEDGRISLHLLRRTEDASMVVVRTVELPVYLCPTKAVHRLQWRGRGSSHGGQQLAVASADSSLRVFHIDIDALLASS